MVIKSVDIGKDAKLIISLNGKAIEVEDSEFSDSLRLPKLISDFRADQFVPPIDMRRLALSPEERSFQESLANTNTWGQLARHGVF